MIKNRIAIAACSFVLGTVAPSVLKSEPVHKACVKTVAAGMRAKSRYEGIVEEARAQVDDIVAEATYVNATEVTATVE